MSFCKSSLNYVAGIQSIQERLKFEFAEILSLFMYVMKKVNRYCLFLIRFT